MSDKETAFISDAKDAIMGFLSGMGHDPFGLVINKLDAQFKPGNWLLEGEFQKGFMGDTMNFSCEYNYELKSTNKMEVSPSERRDSGFA